MNTMQSKNRLGPVHFLPLLFCLLWSPLLTAQTDNGDYRLSVGDQIRVTVYGHEDLSGEFSVDADGGISLPLVGDMKAKDRTTKELSLAITDALKPDYLKNPRVSTEVLSYRPYYVMGEVSQPGSYPFVKGMTVVNAVAVAGGFTYRARKGRITIVRETSDGAKELEVEFDTQLKPGDVINVPERFF